MGKKKKQPKNPAGQEFTDDSLIKVLGRCVPGFKQVRPWVNQFHLAEVLRMAGSSRRRHNQVDDAITIPYQEIYRRFGRGGKRFHDLAIDKLGLFTVAVIDKERGTEFSISRGSTRAYHLTDLAQNAISEWLDSSRNLKGDLVWENGNPMRTPRRAIAAKDANGVTAKNETTRGQITSAVPVDADGMDRYIKHLKEEIDARRYGTADAFHAGCPLDMLEDRLAFTKKLRRMLWTTVGAGRYLIHRYVEQSTGRLYARGLSLQNTPREIRRAVLTGCYDYDLENCHFVIFQHLCRDLDFPTPMIDRYIKDKDGFRRWVSDKIGRSVKMVKQALIALMYGATRSEYWDAAIPRALGSGASQFYALPDVAALMAEIKDGGAAIIASQKVSTRGTILNRIDKPIDATEKPKRILAHIVQGIEAKMLQAARLMYTDEIILLQHDGFTTTKQIDREPLKAAIRELGYEVEFSEELLQMVAGFGDIPNSKTAHSGIESETYFHPIEEYAS